MTRNDSLHESFCFAQDDKSLMTGNDPLRESFCFAQDDKSLMTGNDPLRESFCFAQDDKSCLTAARFVAAPSRRSELVLQRELNNSGTDHSRSGNFAEPGAWAKCRTGIAKNRMIEEVEELGTKLDT
jgi:hypothetical protein